MGIGYHGVVGPFFFDGNVNGARYLEMLSDRVLPVLRQWPNFEDLVLVQDGASAHWTLAVRGFLNENLPGGWIGRDSPFICWPPRSPDLTPMDFFVWGHLKGRLYRGHPFPSLQVLRARIEEEARAIPLNMIRSALNEFWNRLLVCEERTGLSVEMGD